MSAIIVPTLNGKLRSTLDRLEPITESGCLVWTGTCKRNGYAYVSVDGKEILLHRFLYESLVGPIAPGMQIDHLCRVRSCGNVAHLEVVTQRENVLRGEGRTAMNARKTHCTKGHPLVPENLAKHGDRKTRDCRICAKVNNRESYRRRVLGLSAPDVMV